MEHPSSTESGQAWPRAAHELGIIALALLVLLWLELVALPLLEGSIERSIQRAEPWSWLSLLPRWETTIAPGRSNALGITLVAALLGVYLVGLDRVRKLAPRRSTLLIILPLTAILTLPAIAAPPIRGADIFYYAFQGRLLGREQLNPYVFPPRVRETDPWFPLVSPAWRDLTTGYGPSWLLAEATIDHLADSGGGVADGARIILIWRGIFAGLTIANAALIWLILGVGHRVRAPIGTLAYAWNPLVLTVGLEHNDTLMLFLALLGLWFQQHGRGVPTAASFTLSALVKYYTAPLLMGYLLWQWRNGSPRERIWPVLASSTIIAVTILPFDPLIVVRDYPTYLIASGRVGHLAQVPLEVLLAVGVGAILRLSQSSRHPNFQPIFRDSILALVIYLAFLSRDWFPWYLITALGLTALEGGWALIGIATAGATWLLTLHEGLAYLIGASGPWLGLSRYPVEAFVLFGLPAATVLLVRLGQRQRWEPRRLSQTGLIGIVGLTVGISFPVLGLLGDLPPVEAEATTPGVGPTVISTALEWEDWSWGTRVDQIGTRTGPDGPRSVCVTFLSSDSSFYAHASGLDTKAYRNVEMTYDPGDTPPDELRLTARGATGQDLGSVRLNDYREPGQINAGWLRARIPLSALGATAQPVSGILVHGDRDLSGRQVCLQRMRFE